MLAVAEDPAFAERWLESARDWAITGALRTGAADLSPAFRRLHADLRRHEEERPPAKAPAGEREAWHTAHRNLHQQLFFAFTQSLPTTEQRSASRTGADAPGAGDGQDGRHPLRGDAYALYVEPFTGADGAVEVVSVCRHPDGSLEATHGPLSADAAALLARFRDDEGTGGEAAGAVPAPLGRMPVGPGWPTVCCRPGCVPSWARLRRRTRSGCSCFPRTSCGTSPTRPFP